MKSHIYRFFLNFRHKIKVNDNAYSNNFRALQLQEQALGTKLSSTFLIEIMYFPSVTFFATNCSTNDLDIYVIDINNETAGAQKGESCNRNIAYPAAVWNEMAIRLRMLLGLRVIISNRVAVSSNIAARCACCCGNTSRWYANWLAALLSACSHLLHMPHRLIKKSGSLQRSS